MSGLSVHAQTIRDSVVVTGDGNTVTSVFGETGVRLSLERRQVPAPDRRRPPRPGEPPRELDIFAPLRRIAGHADGQAIRSASQVFLDNRLGE